MWRIKKDNISRLTGYYHPKILQMAKMEVVNNTVLTLIQDTMFGTYVGLGQNSLRSPCQGDSGEILLK